MTRRVYTLLAGLLACLFLLAATPAHAAPASRPASSSVAIGPLESAGCGGIFIISSICRATLGNVNDVIHGQFVKAVGDALGGNGATAEQLYHSGACLTSPLDCLANATADAAGSAFRWLWSNIDTATSIDLVPLFHPFTGGGQSLMDVTIEVAALVGLALFLVQIILSALRAEPGGLGRAASGLVSAYIGSIVAILSIPLLDAAITQVCNAIVKTVTGNDLSGFGHTLAVAMSLNGLANSSLPVVLILIAFAIIVSAVIIWAAMMIRKMLVVVAAVFAPLAFSGATADMTKSWVRRWIEVTLALLFSKLILVIIMTIGFMMMNGYGQHSGITNTLTNVTIGVLLLALGGFAPLMALKMVHFAGDGLIHLHAQAAATRAQVQSIATTPQKVQSLGTRTSWARQDRDSAIGSQKNSDGRPAGGEQRPARPPATDAHTTPAPGVAIGVMAARQVVTAPSNVAHTVDGAAERMRPRSSRLPPNDNVQPPNARERGSE